MEIGFIVFPLVILAIILFAFIGRAYWVYSRLKKNGLRTQGEITDYEEYSTIKGKKSFFPIIKFRTNHGQEIHQRTLYGFGSRYYIEKGSKVEVIYSEKTPSRFMLDHYNPFKVNTAVLIAIIFCFSMAIMVFLLSYNNPYWLDELIGGFK